MSQNNRKMLLMGIDLKDFAVYIIINSAKAAS